MVPDFVNYALSTKGQAVVRDNGFVDLNVVLRDAEPCTDKCPPKYAALIAHAKRLSFDFRFRNGGEDLDSRGARDIDRLVAFLRDYPGASLVLVGFSEAGSDAAANVRLSKERAGVVAKQLAMRGLKIANVDGYGAAMPIAATASATDRERRVEVWLQPSH
jgi:phosphate transport system substrate-binding protein